MPSLTLEKKFESLPPNFVVFVAVDSSEAATEILRYLLKRTDSSGIYITLDRPSKAVKERLARSRIDDRNLYYVDLISETAGAKIETSGTLFSGSPSNLTGLSITISSALESMKAKNKFIFFDTLSTLFSYNPASVVIKFVHFLAVRMKSLDVTGVFILVKKQLDEKTMSLMSGFVDGDIEV